MRKSNRPLRTLNSAELSQVDGGFAPLLIFAAGAAIGAVATWAGISYTGTVPTLDVDVGVATVRPSR